MSLTLTILALLLVQLIASQTQGSLFLFVTKLLRGLNTKAEYTPQTESPPPSGVIALSMSSLDTSTPNSPSGTSFTLAQPDGTPSLTQTGERESGYTPTEVERLEKEVWEATLKDDANQFLLKMKLEEARMAEYNRLILSRPSMSVVLSDIMSSERDLNAQPGNQTNESLSNSLAVQHGLPAIKNSLRENAVSKLRSRMPPKR
ncbi:unnamed protein product [Sphagnum balticum]